MWMSQSSNFCLKKQLVSRLQNRSTSASLRCSKEHCRVSSRHQPFHWILCRGQVDVHLWLFLWSMGLCPKPIPLVLTIFTCCNPHGMSQTWGTPRIKWYINCNFLRWPNSKGWYPHVSQLQYGSPVSKNRLAPSVDNYVYHFFGANPLSETVPSSMVMVLVQYQLP